MKAVQNIYVCHITYPMIMMIIIIMTHGQASTGAGKYLWAQAQSLEGHGAEHGLAQPE